MIRPLKYTYLTAALALMLLGSGTNVHACSWFNPCKPAVHHAKKAKPNATFAKHQLRLDDHEGRFRTYMQVLAGLQRQIADLQGQISALKKPN